jgi:Rieske Fe-S protein
MATITASRHLLAGNDLEARSHHRVRLLDSRDVPVRTQALGIGENYLFHYPFAATPCFLVDTGTSLAHESILETETGERYRWTGGVGPKRSIVAFSAICAHRMTHPARSVSFINYRHDDASFLDTETRKTQRDRVIYCCSEKSVYDVTQGARVLGGPAPQPLAAVVLDYESHDDGLYATGIAGGDMFESFFEKFGFRLALEMKTTNIQEVVRGGARLTPVREYCNTQILC